MSSIVISGDTSGAITLAAPAVSGTNTATLPAATGTVMVSGNMPAFRAGASATQSLTVNTNTKIQFNSKLFDTNNNYDNTTNYRFTPAVAGYYQITAGASAQTTATTTAIVPFIYKNGSTYETGCSTPCSVYSYGYSQVTSLVYCNGSTDYIEAYAQVTGASGSVTCIGTYFQATMTRAA